MTRMCLEWLNRKTNQTTATQTLALSLMQVELKLVFRLLFVCVNISYYNTAAIVPVFKTG